MAGLMGAAGVGLAAVGAHLSAEPMVTTAAYFLLFHAAAMVGFCAAAAERRAGGLLAATALIALGTLLFSGELALHALRSITIFQRLAPVGGSLVIAGWLVAAIALPSALGKARGSL